VTQFEKPRIAFALSFLKEEVGAHRQMGGGAISRFHSATRAPAPVSSLRKGGSPENSMPLARDGTTTFDSIHLAFISAHLRSWGV